MSSTPEKVKRQVLVTCLACYPGGSAHYAWIPVTSVKEMTDQIQAMLSSVRKSFPCEEWAIHDTGEFPYGVIKESTSLEDVVAINQLLEKHGEVASHVLNYYGGEIKDARKALEDEYIGCFKSLADYAYEWAEQIYDLKAIPADIEQHINWQEMGEAHEINGNILAFELNGEVHVFSYW